jgi:hypothetical protein
VNESEPDRRAAKQRVQQQIQITIHDSKVAITSGGVKWFFGRQPATICLPSREKP